MSKKFKPLKVEQKPWHVEAVQITEENIHEIAVWIGAVLYTVSSFTEFDKFSVEFGLRGWNPRGKNGDYIVLARDEKGEIESVAGWPREKFETDMRDGWS